MRRSLVLIAFGFGTVIACDDVTQKGFDPGDSGAPVPLDASMPPPTPADGEAPDANDASTTTDASDAAIPPDASDGGDGGVVVIPPTVNGTIGANEYGVHTDGQNQKTEPDTAVTWFMQWNDVTFHVAVSSASLAEGAILYFGAGAVAPNAGTDADGTATGFATYDNTKLDPLPFRATAVLYFKNGYQEFRVWNGVSAWGPATTTGIVYASSGNVREIAVPWTAIRPGGRPASFAWTGYVTSTGGFAYGEMPPENPSGAIGTAATFPHFYHVTDATPGSGTKPFAIRKP